MGLTACDNDDLSDINERYRAQQAVEFPVIQFPPLSLTPEQVVSDATVTSDAGAQVSLTIDSFDGSIQGSVTHSETIAPSDVSLYEGRAGLIGERVFRFQKVPDDPYAWQVPGGQQLSGRLLERLNNAELYVQISTPSYPQGELRTQVYKRCLQENFPCIRIVTVDFSRDTLDSQAPHDAGGKGFVTIEDFGDNTKLIRGVVRITGFSPSVVALVSIANRRNPDTRQSVFNLEQVTDYWQIQEQQDYLVGAVLPPDASNALDNGRLFFVATSADPLGGEIAGHLSIADNQE